MEESTLYSEIYNGSDSYLTYEYNGERLLCIYQGIYQHPKYSAVRYLGGVNITKRQYCKAAKRPHKVLRHVGDSIILYEYHVSNEKEYMPIDTLLTNHGYDQQLINDIKNAILTMSSNPSIKIGEWVDF